MNTINGIEAVELLGSADPALAQETRQRGRKPVVERTAAQPLTINGIEGVIFGTSASGPGSVIRLDSADPALAYQARQRGQRPIVVVNSSGTAVPADWFNNASYDTLSHVADFNNDRYAMPLMGSELVTNGTFDTDLTGWELKFNGTITHSSGRIRVTADGGASAPRALQTLSGLTIGKFYQFSATSAAQSAAVSNQIFIGTQSSGSSGGAVAVGGTGTTLRTETLIFTATQTTHYVVLVHNSIAAASWTEFDNATVKEIVLTATGRTYGSELVVNGDFATGPTLGAELLDNGDMSGALVADPTTGWQVVPGGGTVDITGGILNITGNGSPTGVDQSFVTTNGQAYELTLTVATNTINILVGTSLGGGQLINSSGNPVGTLTLRFVATGGLSYIRLQKSGATLTTIDNVTIKAFTQPASSWLLKTSNVGFEQSTISGGTLNLTGDGTNSAYADQSFTTVNGQVYELTFTVGGNIIGAFLGTAQGGNTVLASPTASYGIGTNTVKFTALGATTWIRFQRVSATIATVDNVSIKNLTAIGVYPKQSATFDEFFAFAAASDAARTYADANGIIKNMMQNPTQTNLITNGDFTTSMTGWTDNGGSSAVVSGQAVLTTGGGLFTRAVQAITTVIGAAYVVEFTGRVITALNYACRVTTSSDGGAGGQIGVSASLTNTSDVTTTLAFTATATTTYIALIANSGGGPTLTAAFDNVSVRLSGVNARRMTYANAKRQLRLENAGTNLCIRSEEFDNAAWTRVAVQAFGSGSTANAIASPAGVVTADKIVEDTTAASAHNIQLTAAIVTVADTTHTVSVYAKAGERFWLRVFNSQGGNGYQADFNLSDGTITGGTILGTGTYTGSTITAVGGGWYRCSIIGRLGAGGTSSNPRFVLGDAAGAFTYNGDGASGLYLWGAQVEANNFATDYIPTTTATVTRAIETARFSPAVEAVLQRAQASVLVRGQLNAPIVSSTLRVVAGMSGTNLLLAQRGSTPTEVIATDGTTTMGRAIGVNWSLSPFGVVFGYDASGRAITGNSISTSTDAVGSPGTRTTIYLSRTDTNSANTYGDGYYDLVGFSPERLPATTLQALAVAAT